MRVRGGGTIWGDQFANLIKDQVSEYVLYEIGAFDGHDVELFKQVLPQTKAFAFEASPTTYKAYLTNKPFPTYNLAVGDRNEMITFYESRERGSSSIFHRKENYWKQEEAQMVRLDDFIKENNLPKPTIVKVDTEGATYNVLLGMGELLKTTPILYLETEPEEIWPEQKIHYDVEQLLKDTHECILLHDNGNQFDSVWKLKSL